jgi:hypothetical protein
VCTSAFFDKELCVLRGLFKEPFSLWNKWQEDIAEVEDQSRRTHVADYLDKNGRSVLVSSIPLKVVMLCNGQSINRYW